ncbi:MAG: ribosome small subunit-dependent GTPase A [Candidatus Cloacimonadaceae bacterium]|nr:ribosome small subunit-dependent GTPase A [Candidatus Cloacimonadaceae bacterium]MDP3114483.1 ribosome small subunit-dependent GTPase A [Candidatus Cloacimonadaceae bacterium]
MKQKDKKKRTRYTGRLRAISLPDLDILDDEREKSEYKTLRAAHKQQKSFKSGMELLHGRITEIMSNYLYVVEAGGTYYNASLCGRMKQFIYGSQALSAVGDYVQLDISHAPNHRIENILPRKNTLSRFTGGSFQKEIILAANIDQVIITVSWRMPMIKPGLIDRYLCIAALQNISPVIVINKIDLCEDHEELEETISYYRQIGIPILCTSIISGEGMEELRSLVKDRDSVFSGQSGTGKSSLINWLQPGLNLLTAEVSDYNEKGRHTTTQAILIPWSFGGHLLDTPGIKTVNLHSEDKALIPKVFPGFDTIALNCRFRDCSHTCEEDCAVLQALEADIIPIERYDTYLRILSSL